MKNQARSHELLTATITFVDETTNLTNQQLFWLELGRQLLPAAITAEYKSMIAGQVAGNVETLALASMQLARISPLVISHPQTGETGKLIGIGVDEANSGYMAMVVSSGDQADSWPLLAGNQLRLESPDHSPSISTLD